jgi:hypothetical protein
VYYAHGDACYIDYVDMPEETLKAWLEKGVLCRGETGLRA